MRYRFSVPRANQIYVSVAYFDCCFLSPREIVLNFELNSLYVLLAIGVLAAQSRS
jgi:hypothetical protein